MGSDSLASFANAPEEMHAKVVDAEVFDVAPAQSFLSEVQPRELFGSTCSSDASTSESNFLVKRIQQGRLVEIEIEVEAPSTPRSSSIWSHLQNILQRASFDVFPNASLDNSSKNNAVSSIEAQQQHKEARTSALENNFSTTWSSLLQTRKARKNKEGPNNAMPNEETDSRHAEGLEYNPVGDDIANESVEVADVKCVREAPKPGAREAGHVFLISALLVVFL